MIFLRQWLLISFTLILGGGQLFAATREQRDFAAAASAFQDGMWSRAEVEFAEFVEKHPQSPLVPQAALMQAQADFKQSKWLPAIALLQANEQSAGVLADQYAYWIGQAQFTNSDYQDAAETFARLARSFPTSEWQLDAVVNEAAARAKLGQWTQVMDLLQKPGVFQDATLTNATDSRVLDGHLLLARALLAQKRPAGAVAILQSPAEFKNNLELEWGRLYLLCQAQLASGNTNDALAVTTNLIETANQANRPDLVAQSVAKQAEIFEANGRLAEAAFIYAENLTNNAPANWQRQAILKIAELSASQANFTSAENALENFQTSFPNSPEQDSVLLALGELHLKDYVAQPSATNDSLPQAQAYFDQFISTYTNSPLLGNAFLDRGWSFWIQERWADSSADFQAAVQSLPPSIDLAVAHFKLGDAQFRLNNFADARDNYQAVVNDFTNYPEVGRNLGAQALYQTLRVCLKLADYSGASNALAQILTIYPVSTVAEKGILLEGEGLSDLGQPSRARELFQKFVEVFPDSPQLSEVKMEIARTYEQEANWPQAITVYNSWIDNYSNDTKNVPSVKYARAWANFKVGNETNAFLLFTNFVAEYTNNGLAPVTQWWLGDYYYGRGDWANAEKNYKILYQTWPTLPLAYAAQLMAGRAAMGRQDYDTAISYLISVTGDTNCQTKYPDLDKLALFAYGDAEMQMPSSDTNNPLANFQTAITVFQIICKQYPGTLEAAHAWGELGDCYFQLAAQAPSYDQVTNAYNQATNAYTQVMASGYAEIAARSQAQIGIGLVLEKLAAQTNSVAQTTLLQSALDNYLDVFFGNNLRNGESADPFWVKKAGLQALPLLETLGSGDPNKFIDQMETLFPQMRDSLEKKRLEISRPQNQ
jgi:TolA-binding protein